MSSGEPIEREEALSAAYGFIETIEGHVARFEVAGSLRRGKASVHDIEIVAVPRFEFSGGLFDFGLTADERQNGKNLLHSRMQELLAAGWINQNRSRKDLKKNPFGEKYYRINFSNPDHFNGRPEYPIDLFVVIPPAQWGVILVIRTGSAEFSHSLVQKGWPHGITVRNGHLEDRSGKIIPTQEERDVFDALHVGWIEPEKREVEYR